MISAIIEAIIAKSSDLLAPRVTVPLIGAVDKILSLQRNSVSGEDDTIARPKSTASMYAENGAKFDVESYANVHHLVSHIEGVLLDDKTSGDALGAIFPGGSIGYIEIRF